MHQSIADDIRSAHWPTVPRSGSMGIVLPFVPPSSSPRISHACMAVVFVATCGAFLSAARATEGPDLVDFFETEVRPVLAGACVRCHGPDKQRGGLRLDSRGAIIAGGDS